MKRKIKANELLWLLGILLSSLGVCLTIKADFGLSIFAAPPYIIHHKLHSFHWLTHGMTDVVFQLAILLVMVIAVGKFKKKFFYCLVTTFFCALMLDIWVIAFGGDAPFATLAGRVTALTVGMLVSAMAFACFHKTTLPIQVDEYFIEEISEHFHKKEIGVKVADEIVFCIISFGLALGLNKSLHGLGVGTIVLTVFIEPFTFLFIKLFDGFLSCEPVFPKLSKIFTIKHAHKSEH